MSVQLIEGKRGKEAEFFVNLFEWCNLRCSFCWQDHDKWDGIETIVSRADDISDRARIDHRGHFIINLMGGELFADQIPDYIFQDYREMVARLQTLMPRGKSFEINWVTNLVFENTARVRALVTDVRALGITTKLTTSFDFAGRFSKYNKDLFDRNVYSLRDIIGTISVVLTKGNIKAMLTRKDELFERMYRDGFYFYFDYYSPESNAHLHAPSDLELRDGLIHLANNYPNTWPVQGWMRNDRNEMSCRGSLIVDHTGFKGQCRSLLTDQMKTQMHSAIQLDNNTTMEEKFINKYDCVSCEYFQRCGMGCFLQHDFAGREELDECLYKQVFRAIL